MPTIELVTNGGCESALVAGEIPNWTEVVGTTWTQSSSFKKSGSYSFYSGITASGADAAEIRQDIDVSAYAALIDGVGLSFVFSAWADAHKTGGADDTGRIRVEYRDGGGGVLATYDTGTISNTEGSSSGLSLFVHKTDTRNAPSGTRTVRIRFSNARTIGTSTDAFMDDVSLQITIADTVFDSPSNQGMQVHPYNLLWDPSATLTANTEAAGYEVTRLRDSRNSRKWRTTGTTAILNVNVVSVDAGTRHLHHVILQDHNLIPGDTIRIETNNGGADVYDHTFTVPQNPDTDPSIWGEAGITLATYKTLYFPFGLDALSGATQIKVTITTNSPNTYVECKLWLGWSLEFDRNFFYGWNQGLIGQPLASTDKVKDVITLSFGAATKADWRKVQFLNRQVGVSNFFCISLEPGASSAVTAKDGLRQHRLTFCGHLNSLIQTQESFIDYEQFVMVFVKL